MRSWVYPREVLLAATGAIVLVALLFVLQRFIDWRWPEEGATEPSALTSLRRLGRTAAAAVRRTRDAVAERDAEHRAP